MLKLVAARFLEAFPHPGPMLAKLGSPVIVRHVIHWPSLKFLQVMSTAMGGIAEQRQS